VEIEPEKGMCCLSASEFHIPPAQLSIAGNPKGKHAGGFSLVPLIYNPKDKSDWSRFEQSKTGPKGEGQGWPE